RRPPSGAAASRSLDPPSLHDTAPSAREQGIPDDPGLSSAGDPPVVDEADLERRLEQLVLEAQRVGELVAGGNGRQQLHETALLALGFEDELAALPTRLPAHGFPAHPARAGARPLQVEVPHA